MKEELSKATKKKIADLKATALVLRNMAAKLVEQLDQLDPAPTSPAKLKEIEKDAEILMRLRSGKRK